MLGRRYSRPSGPSNHVLHQARGGSGNARDGILRHQKLNIFAMGVFVLPFALGLWAVPHLLSGSGAMGWPSSSVINKWYWAPWACFRVWSSGSFLSAIRWPAKPLKPGPTWKNTACCWRSWAGIIRRRNRPAAQAEVYPDHSEVRPLMEGVYRQPIDNSTNYIFAPTSRAPQQAGSPYRLSIPDTNWRAISTNAPIWTLDCCHT